MSHFNQLSILAVVHLTVAAGAPAQSGDTAATRPASKWRVGVPITTYWAGPTLTDDVARQMSEGGFNLVWATESNLEVAARHGLRAMLNDPLIAPTALDDASKRSQLEALIERVKRHPAMYAYFITDEPSAAAFPALGKLVDFLRSRDPAHLAYINLFPTYANNDQLGTRGDTVTAYREHLRQYMEVVRPDLVSWDHYQFAINGKDNDQYFLNLAMIRKVSMEAGVPYLNIVQACTWAPEAMRAPTPDELRFLVYTTLAYGAQGISYFVYSWPQTYKPGVGQMITPEGKPTELYEAARKLNPAFITVASHLQKLKSLGVYHLGMMPPGGEACPEGLPFRFEPPIEKQEYKPPEPIRGILLGVFGPAGASPRVATHAVVVNLDYKKPREITLAATKGLETLRVPVNEWSVPALRLQATLEPGGGLLLRLADHGEVKIGEGQEGDKAINANPVLKTLHIDQTRP